MAVARVALHPSKQRLMGLRSLSRARTGAGHAENDPRFWSFLYVIIGGAVILTFVFLAASPAQRRLMTGPTLLKKNGRY